MRGVAGSPIVGMAAEIVGARTVVQGRSQGDFSIRKRDFYTDGPALTVKVLRSR
jgi:hypothetical protein